MSISTKTEKKSSKKFLIAFLVAALVAGLVASTAIAFPGDKGFKKGKQRHGKFHQGRRGNKGRFWKSLPAETKTKLMNLKLTFKQKVMPLRAEMKLVGTNLRVELSKDSPSKSKINALINKKVSLKSQLIKARVSHKLAVKGLLTGKALQMFNLKLLKGRKGFKGKKGCFGKKGRHGRFGKKGRFGSRR